MIKRISLPKKIPIITMVLLVEGSLLFIGLVWMSLRKIPVFDSIKITPGTAAAGLAAGVVLLTSSLLFYLIDKCGFDLKLRKLIENQMYPVFKNITFPEILLIALMSGFCEEFFFRGILLPELGVFVSCLVFGILHTSSKETWFLGLWSAMGGLFFSLLYLRTGNLFIPITAHAINNLIAVSYIRYVYFPLKINQSKDNSSHTSSSVSLSLKEETGCEENLSNTITPQDTSRQELSNKTAEVLLNDISVEDSINERNEDEMSFWKKDKKDKDSINIDKPVKDIKEIKKDSINKDAGFTNKRRADDLDEEGIGTVYEPQ